jgi:hypothetical protein
MSDATYRTGTEGLSPERFVSRGERVSLDKPVRSLDQVLDDMAKAGKIAERAYQNGLAKLAAEKPRDPKNFERAYGCALVDGVMLARIKLNPVETWFSWDLIRQLCEFRRWAKGEPLQHIARDNAAILIRAELLRMKQARALLIAA